MKIPYESDNGLCSTPCPNGKTNGFIKEPVKVGSYSCSKCKYHIMLQDNTCYCNFDQRDKK